MLMHADPELIDGPMRHPDFALAGGMVPGKGTATGGSVPNLSPLKDVERVRSVFPETWLWSNATLGFVNAYDPCISNSLGY